MESFIDNVHVGGRRGNSLINRKMIFRILGILLLIECFMFLVCAGVSLLYKESDYIYFIYTTLIAAVVACCMLLIGRKADNKLTRRDGYCIVAFTWVLFTCFGMLPFYISGEIPSVSDAFFETMSGFTTTGATILDDIESLPHGMLFWRNLTQWIGGLGIVFFTIAVLPIFGVGNQVLFSAEATGVNHNKIHPKIGTMARLIWSVYLMLTISETILLMVGGMSLFDALCHSFSTTATGGYSTKQASIAYWNSPYIEYVVSVFMILSGANFTLYFMCLKGKFDHIWKNTEFKWYLGSLGVLTLIITLSLIVHNSYGVELAFRRALFQVSTIHTTCGFATDDYNLWAPFTWLLLVYAMVSGGSTGSTSSGLKTLRVLIVVRNVKNEFSRLIHPRAVLPVKVNQQSLSQNTISTVTTFVVFYIMCIFMGWLTLMFLGLSIVDALGISVSSMGNIGPGLQSFGPAYSWYALPEGGKWVASFLMLIGRLELFGILLMFAPSFWKSR